MGFGEAISSGFNNMSNFNGRSSRSAFWWWMLFIWVLQVVISLFTGVGRSSEFGLFYWIGVIIGLILWTYVLVAGDLRGASTAGAAAVVFNGADKPLAATAAFLDGLDAAERPLAAENRLLAALGPKMLELARTRTAGTHPYLVTPELTASARAGVGPDAIVASEQGVVLDTNPTTARATARLHLATYLSLPNYSNNWKRQGFTDDDLTDGGMRFYGRFPGNLVAGAPITGQIHLPDGPLALWGEVMARTLDAGGAGPGVKSVVSMSLATVTGSSACSWHASARVLPPPQQ